MNESERPASNGLLNIYALLLTGLGIAIAAESNTTGGRAIGSVLAGVAGSALLRPYILSVGEDVSPRANVR